MTDNAPGARREPPTNHTLLLRVYYEDTDAAGVVYYANYLRFCERARTEFLRALGFEQQQLLCERRIGFVVKSLRGDYVSPARLDDQLGVDTRIVRLGGASMTFEQKIRRGAELLFDASISIACVDTTRQRPTPIPADLRILLKATVQP